jgi:hypothetical protein
MVLSVYCDESGTHGDESPSVIMAGYIADVAQWAAFETAFRAHLREFDVPYFHARKLRGSKFPFKGWKIVEKQAFHEGMVRIIDDNLAIGFSAVLGPADYRAFYKDGTTRRKVREDTQYGICFRCCLLAALQYGLEHRDGGEINFTLEGGAKNSPDAVRIFNEFKTELKPEHQSLLGAISFGTKQDCLMLAPADMLAYRAFQVELSSNPDAFTSPETNRLDAGLSDRLPRRDRDGHIPMVKIPVTPQTLGDLKEFLRIRHEGGKGIRRS